MLPTRFLNQIRRHLIANAVEFPGYPLLLGIFGNPGEGKSYQLRESLRSEGVGIYSINAADFESDRAGQPAKLLLETYVRAASSIRSNALSAIVIDDIDTTVGEWESNTGTVNHQQILAQLMHLADSPNEIEGVGVVRRVPIFVTGNDFSKLYAPLRRPGRMARFFWQPSIEERLVAVEALLDSLGARHLGRDLLNAVPDEPIAFYADVIRLAGISQLDSLLASQVNRVQEVARDPERYLGYLRAAFVDLSLAEMVSKAHELRELEFEIQRPHFN